MNVVANKEFFDSVEKKYRQKDDVFDISSIQRIDLLVTMGFVTIIENDNQQGTDIDTQKVGRRGRGRGKDRE